MPKHAGVRVPLPYGDRSQALPAELRQKLRDAAARFTDPQPTPEML